MSLPGIHSLAYFAERRLDIADASVCGAITWVQGCLRVEAMVVDNAVRSSATRQGRIYAL